MYIVKESIDIAASPEKVREKFLDFASLQTYHKDGFFKHIGPEDPNAELVPGTQMKNLLELGTVKSPLIENSPHRFAWAGGLSGIFVGEHSFIFEPSKTTPGGTTFIQEEKFTGALSFVMGENVVAKTIGVPEKTHRGWKRYNEDLKAWCEK